MKPPELPDRLRFVMWLAQLTVGCEATNGSFALAIGKHINQVSKWLADAGMSDENARLIGATVGVDDLWLRYPDHPKAEAPELFDRWWEKQLEWRASKPVMTAADRPAAHADADPYQLDVVPARQRVAEPPKAKTPPAERTRKTGKPAGAKAAKPGDQRKRRGA